ncbi:MAG: DUF4296 domain-containing protein [Ferruginibacter sp.]|nr:DUF4296 domain-containing protein [Ferruginibacter sp.]
MEVLLWEQIRAEAYTNDFIGKDNSKNLFLENFKLQQKIFDKYNVDKNKFYKSYNYYLKHSYLLKIVVDSIVAKQTRIKEAERANEIRSHNNLSFSYNNDPFKLLELFIPPKAFTIIDTNCRNTIQLNKEISNKTIDSMKLKYLINNNQLLKKKNKIMPLKIFEQ